MGTAVSFSNDVREMRSRGSATNSGSRSKPSATLLPMTVSTTAKFNCVRKTEIAPIIIRNCKEEFQQITEFSEPLVRGSLCENIPEHWLIKKRHVLVRDVLPSCDELGTMETFKSPNLRRADGPFPVYGTGQPTKAGLEKVVSFLQSQNYNVHLFNLREDGCLYIKEDEDMVPYSTRDIEKLDVCDVSTGRTIAQTIENEAEIRKQIVDLATFKEENEFCVYDKPETENNAPRKCPVICEDDVATSEEVLQRLQFCNKNVSYRRLAFPPDRAAYEENFDAVVESVAVDDSFFNQADNVYPCLVFIDREGNQTSTTAMVLGCLLLARRHNNLESEEEFEDGDSKGEYSAINELTQKLPNGYRLKREVDAAIDLCGQRCNIRSDIWESSTELSNISAEYEIQGINARQYFYEKFIDQLERYFFLICFNAYLHEQYSKRFQKKFSSWLQNNLHLLRILDRLDVAEKTTHPELLSQGIRSLVADDYIGLDILSTSMTMNVSNFRQILGIPIFGTAQPSRQGLISMVQELTGGRNSHSSVVLINLRNDVHIEGDQCMLSVRESDHLDVPITIPGVSNTEIEQKESQLKRHLMQGAVSQAYNEIDKPAELKAYQYIYTFKEIVEHATSKEDCSLVYHRLPVRDDFSIDERDYDDLMYIINNYIGTDTDETSPAIVFSCRTGKSRTTTAMAVAGLVYCHKKGFPYGAKPGEQERVSVPNAAFTKGDFIVVKKLVSLLPNGQQIKREVDFMLDMCSETMTPMHYHTREVIFVTYNQMRRAKNRETRERLLRKSIAYLERYIYLILFNAYLNMERQGNWEKPFSMWLREVGPRSGVYDVLNDVYFMDFEMEPCQERTARYRWLRYRPHELPCRGSLI